MNSFLPDKVILGLNGLTGIILIYFGIRLFGTPTAPYHHGSP